MLECVLGIDTSCYTTSVALLDIDGNLLANCRKLLTVKQGNRGLAQSEMVFQHTRNLPLVFKQALDAAGKVKIVKIGASSCPRPITESYMPAFLVGYGYAQVLAMANSLPLKLLSHQENHILAGKWSARGPEVKEYLALHVSGGTTEVVAVKDCGDRLAINLLGGSSDLHAGQFIDRVGVALGLPFPAGPHLEALADHADHGQLGIPVSVKNMSASFSGPETHVKKLIAQGAAPAVIAAGVEQCIGMTIWKLIEAAHRVTGYNDVLLVGGVTANLYIRSLLQDLAQSRGLKLYLPGKEFSPDNAVGCAYFTLC